MNLRSSTETGPKKGLGLIDFLCAAFYSFVQGLAIALAIAYILWTTLGWIAAIVLWGTLGGGAALSMWLAFVVASIWLMIKDSVESGLSRLDRRIEARAHAWRKQST